MLLLLFFAFLSGLVTIFAPCIWPILPIVLSAGVDGSKHKPLGLVTGLSVSFIFFTLALASIVKFFPFDPEVLRYGAVMIIGFLGLTLLVPWFGERLEVLVSRFGSLGARFTQGKGTGFGTGFVTGAALGLIWTPCAGPILAAVATLAATQTVGFGGVALITAYVVGVSIPLYVLTLIGGRVLNRTRNFSQYTGLIQKIFGAVMIFSAVLIFTGYDKKLQTKVLDVFPEYSSFLYIFENQAEQTGQLENIRQGQQKPGEKEAQVLQSMLQPQLANLGQAPELTGINGWLNSEGTSLEALRGKVVLIDFWTYSCINCIRTLPHVTGWYEKYKEQGFVVIGVHTPEFAFEHKKDNVAEALKKYNITYPVAQDNDYATWQAYNNRYWPAHYLIDAEGNVRRTHFGEGEYEETEAAIVALLKEAGKDVGMIKGESASDETPRSRGGRTPETYLGSARAERLVSPEPVTGEKQVFSAPATIQQGGYAFVGEWQVEDERAQSSAAGQLTLRFQGDKVFLVMSPEEGMGQSSVGVYLNDQIIDQAVSGKDVRNGEMVIDEERLYEIVDFRGKSQEGVLRLEFKDTTAVYAFTFA